MKKLLTSILCCLIVSAAFAQRTPCVPVNNLNINTGTDANGALVGIGQPDPFWGGFAIAPAYASWNVIANTRILSPATSNAVTGTRTFRRNFYLCRAESVRLNGTFRADNMVGSIRIKSAGSGSTLWSQTPLPTNDPQCWGDNPFGGSAVLPAGQYYIEFVYTNSGSVGGFALSGSLSAAGNVLSNYPDCCTPPCNCNKLPRTGDITGPTCFCWSKNCDARLDYSVPGYGIDSACIRYMWSIQPGITFSGQSTNHISINCGNLAPGTYKISVRIVCGDRERELICTKTLVVCQRISPAFTEVSNGGAITLSALAGGTHYWFLVKDMDNNCSYTAGDTYVFQTGNTVTYNGLLNNQQYVIYHYVDNNCGNGCDCWSSQMLCLKWLPMQMRTAGGRTAQSISNKELDGLADMPLDFRKYLPVTAQRQVEMNR